MISDRNHIMRTLLFAFGLMPIAAQGQGLPAWEDSIARAYALLAQATSDAAREEQCNRMHGFFTQALDEPDAFSYPFARLNFCTLPSSDQRIRLFNWNEPLDNGEYRYHGYVLVRDAPSGTTEVIRLQDQLREPENPENRFFTPDKWLGALYYEIIPMGRRRRKPADTYVLLGWDGKDNLTTRKIVDVLQVTGRKVRFGAPVFETAQGPRKRIILEYSNEVSASVKYFPGKKCIVMDHLSPKSPMLRGIFSEYGPDGTYDLLELDRNKWVLKEDIDVSQFAGDDGRPYVDPRRSR